MRILLTNDDGIDSVGLHLLAKAMRKHGEVVVVAPASEYSGAAAAIGSLFIDEPEVTVAEVEGIDEAWAVAGPPALCVMYARMGAFGGPFDLVVSGINPGANVGRAVYHSGTIGAAVTGRIGGIHGIAVSQAVDGWGVEGQSWDDIVAKQKWGSAVRVADMAVEGFLAEPPPEPVVLNINVPNRHFDDIVGWRRTDVSQMTPRAESVAELTPKPGHEGTFSIAMTWGDPIEHAVGTDSRAIADGEVSITWLSRVTGTTPVGIDSTENAITQYFNRNSS